MKKLLVISELWDKLDEDKTKLDEDYQYVTDDIQNFKRKLTKIKGCLRGNKSSKLAMKINKLLNAK